MNLPVLGFAWLLASAAQAAINISTQATQNMSCSGGVCTATAQKAYLNVNDVTNMLAAGDLKIVSGAGAEDIHLQAPFSWTSTSRLTLDAQRSIEFEKAVSVAGTGALTLITNDGHTGGDYWFDQGASVSFWDTSSSLIINGQSFTLVKDIKTLAADIAANSLGSFALATSYDAAQDGNYTVAPVAALAGQFDGLGNRISNLSISSSVTNAALGMFATLSAGAIIRNTILTKAVVQGGSGTKLGALVANNAGLVTHSRATGTVAGRDSAIVGGLIGENATQSAVIASSTASSSVSVGPVGVAGGLVGSNLGSIKESSSAGTVSNGDNANEEVFLGGLVGDNGGLIDQSASSSAVNLAVGGSGGGLVGYSSGLISHSHATGPVKGDTSVVLGGLVGYTSASQGTVTVFASYATGQVKARGDYLGGLAGIALAGIDSSFATGPVSADATSGLGGLVGVLHDMGSEAGFLERSYAIGAVDGGNNGRVGGCIGLKFHKAPAKQIYCAGETSPGGSVGGFVGDDARSAKRVHSFIHFGYWDLDKGISDPAQGAGNIPDDEGISGLSDAALKSALPEGFDPQVWGQSPKINNGYPYLLANPPPKDNKAIKHRPSGANYAR